MITCPPKLHSKRINLIQGIEVVDGLTGEVLEKETTTSYTRELPSEPAYIKLYLEDVLYLSNMEPSQSGLVYALLQKMNYDCQIVINPAIRRQIANQLNIKVSTLNNNISKLVKGEVIERIDSGIYRANPYLFGRGNWKDINKLRLEVDYNIKGRTFKSIINGKKKTQGDDNREDN